MPLALFLAPLLAGLGWAVWRGFGPLVTGRRDRPGPIEPPPLASRPVLASFATGFGASGGSVHVWGRTSALGEVGLAIATGLLFAALVRSLTALAALARRGE